MKRIRSGAGRSRQQPRIGAPDPALTANAGLAAITELCGRLGVIAALDAAVGPVKQRDRGFGAGELLTGIAAAQLAGEDFLTGLDRQRADAAGQQITPVPGLASTTAAGLARRITPGAVDSSGARPGGGDRADAGRCCPRSGRRRWPAGRSRSTWTPLTWRSTAARSGAWPITTRASGSGGRTWPAGPRPRLSWPPTWATAPMTRARPRRICCAAPWAACPRAGAGFGPGGDARRRRVLRRAAGPRRARRAHRFAIGAKRIAPLWRLLAGIAEDDWHDAIDMDGAQVAVAEYCPDWWPANTRLLIRRVLLAPEQVSADPRSRRRRTLHPDQRALPFPELARAGAIYAYSFILTNLDVTAPDKAIAAEHWYRHRTTVENIFRDSKLGAALRHLPSGYPQVNLAWMWGALLAATMAAWLHQLTAITAGEDILAGHGVRGGKAMIATLRWRLIAVPGRLTRHARHLTLRLPPGHGLLHEVLARLRDLPAPA